VSDGKRKKGGRRERRQGKKSRECGQNIDHRELYAKEKKKKKLLSP
jgi:hypothetical protein